ncbi:MAG: glucoamylase family protein [Bacteroidales bacterium]
MSFQPEIEIAFSEPLAAGVLQPYTSVLLGSLNYNHTVTQVSDSVLKVTVIEDLPYYRRINFKISGGLAEEIGKGFDAYTLEFYTQLDSTDKYPVVSDEELLNIVQVQTFRYFWDFAHPVSGLNRERNTSADNVTSGGSGFGVMAIPVGIERGYITREEGVARLRTIVDFLGTADRFHGAWSHWLSGSTGDVNPFSSKDDGGDLVETSYMAMGLITVRQYLNEAVTDEAALITDINTLLDAIEWDWYTQGENSLTWHWSPNYDFEKNHKIRGWNEALITYVMAASSTTHTISKEVYEIGWGGGPNMVNGNQYFGITLPLGPSYGGPLFFEQYSFIGIDPRNMEDQYANYWEQAVNHTLINRQHCIVNARGYVGYSEDCWGLTASDGNKGYSAHSPTNDRGVITPTAALSSIPFTPEQSMDAMRHFYYKLGDRLWGPYGFYDAFNVTENWFGTSNIAIDQGPMLLMIENYRTGLLWDLFMSAPEVQAGLTKLGFTY